MSQKDHEVADILISFGQTEEHRALDRFMKYSTGISGYKNFLEMIYNSQMNPEKKHNILYRMLLKIKQNIRRYNIKIVYFDFSYLITLDDAYELINYYISHDNINLTCIN